MNKRYEELYNRAIEMLDNSDCIFEQAVEELDSWNGFADDSKCYPMYEIDDIFYGCKISDFLDKLSPDFDHNDEYFYDSIYGLESTDSPADVYRDNFTSEEVLEALLDEIGGYFNPRIDCEFDDVIDELLNLDPDDEDEDDDLDDDNDDDDIEEVE